jgi:hypothetical protein
MRMKTDPKLGKEETKEDRMNKIILPEFLLP